MAHLGELGAKALALVFFIEQRGPRLSIREACDLLGMSKSALSRTLKAMETAGWCKVDTSWSGSVVTLLPVDLSRYQDTGAPSEGVDGGSHHLPVSRHQDTGVLVAGQVDGGEGTRVVPNVSRHQDTTRKVRKVKRDGTGAVTRAPAVGLLGLDRRGTDLILGDLRSVDQKATTPCGGGEAATGAAVAARSIRTRPPRAINRFTRTDPGNDGREVAVDELKLLTTARAKRDEQRLDFTAPEVVVIFRSNFWRQWQHEDPETNGPKLRDRAAALVRDLAVAVFDGEIGEVAAYLRWIIKRWKRSQDPDVPIKQRPFVSGATPSLKTVLKPAGVFVRDYLADRSRGDE